MYCFIIKLEMSDRFSTISKDPVAILFAAVALIEIILNWYFSLVGKVGSDVPTFIKSDIILLSLASLAGYCLIRPAVLRSLALSTLASARLVKYCVAFIISLAIGIVVTAIAIGLLLLSAKSG